MNIDRKIMGGREKRGREKKKKSFSVFDNP